GPAQAAVIAGQIAGKIDGEVTRILNEGRERAREVLVNHRTALNAIAERLVEVETLEREEFEKLLIANGITPKAKEEEAIV
ncbi:MAG: cell division protein FtsH, partial [Patescibacteria group bacterium]